VVVVAAAAASYAPIHEAVCEHEFVTILWHLGVQTNRSWHRHSGTIG